MKNNKTMLVLLTAILFFYACSETQNKDKEEPHQNSDKPATAISYEEASSLQKNYIETRATFLNEHLISTKVLSTQDVRDVTYKLSDLKQYIAYVEDQASQQGIDESELGIVVYLGAYPTTNENRPDDRRYKDESLGYTTMFFMPSRINTTANKSSIYKSTSSNILEDIDGLNFGGGVPPPHNLE